MNEEIYREFLAWRDIEDPCPKCLGSGVRGYANTTTWRGGIGGQMITSDVCDECWGSGDKFKKWLDLRKLRTQLMEASDES